ncbi:MAG TPA: hypothetical protein VHT75_03005 [Acidimicrobiales bacterium]|nr:hypothetical protein [Acidimicrobiales bacterium]
MSGVTFAVLLSVPLGRLVVGLFKKLFARVEPPEPLTPFQRHEAVRVVMAMEKATELATLIIKESLAYAAQEQQRVSVGAEKSPSKSTDSIDLTDSKYQDSVQDYVNDAVRRFMAKQSLGKSEALKALPWQSPRSVRLRRWFVENVGNVDFETSDSIPSR